MMFWSEGKKMYDTAGNGEMCRISGLVGDTIVLIGMCHLSV